MTGNRLECIKYEITRQDGHFYARCLEADIFTEGVGLEEVVRRLEQAALLHWSEETEEGDFLVALNQGAAPPELVMVISEPSGDPVPPRAILASALQAGYRPTKRRDGHVKLVNNNSGHTITVLSDDGSVE